MGCEGCSARLEIYTPPRYPQPPTPTICELLIALASPSATLVVACPAQSPTGRSSSPPLIASPEENSAKLHQQESSNHTSTNVKKTSSLCLDRQIPVTGSLSGCSSGKRRAADSGPVVGSWLEGPITDVKKKLGFRLHKSCRCGE